MYVSLILSLILRVLKTCVRIPIFIRIIESVPMKKFNYRHLFKFPAGIAHFTGACDALYVNPRRPSRPQGYLPAEPSQGLSSEERRFLERQLQAADDDDDDELDDAYDTFLEELDRRH